MSKDVKLLRNLRQQAQQLVHGEHEEEKIPGQTNIRWGFAIFGFVTLIVFLGEIYLRLGDDGFGSILSSIHPSAIIALQAGIAATAFYLLLPMMGLVLYLLRYWRLPHKATLKRFSPAQIGFSIFALALIIACALNYHNVLAWWFYTHRHYNPASIQRFEWHVFQTVGTEALIGTLVLLILIAFILPKHAKRHVLTKLATNSQAFSLWLGFSTGLLVKRKHKAAMKSAQQVTLTLDDACKNVLVLGGIGAGKTTCTIHPLLLQLLDQDCGGLIFDIKSDFKKAVTTFADKTNRAVITVGPNHHTLNLIAGLSPEMAASFLKSACLLATGHSMDKFWLDTAAELCRNGLGILSFFPEHYSLHGLYLYIFNADFRDEINGKAYTKLSDLEPKKARLYESYSGYYDSIYSTFDDKIKSGVGATVSQILSPFTHPDLIDSFCVQSDDAVLFQSVLDGNVLLVDLPLSKWGLGGKVAYTLIKLRFFNLMQQRVTEPEWNQGRPVFFICDEYQEIVSCSKDGLSDLNFWDKSRSSKTIGIISAQSMSSFYAAINNRDMANALLQNFRQKICFKTEDQTTLDYLNRLTGHVEVARRSYSSQTGHTSVPEKWSKSKHESSNESLSYYDKPLLDPQLIRELGPNKAVALLSVSGYSMDDIIEVKPIFV